MNSVRIMLKKTFIVYDKGEEEKKEYFFISKHSDLCLKGDTV